MERIHTKSITKVDILTPTWGLLHKDMLTDTKNERNGLINGKVPDEGYYLAPIKSVVQMKGTPSSSRPAMMGSQK